MRKVRVGDIVEVTKGCDPHVAYRIGKRYKVQSVDSRGYADLEGVSEGGWRPDEYKIIEKEGINYMGKFYRVKQDTPAWLAGAILEGDSEDGYSATSDLWDAFEEDYPKDYTETAAIVENSPEWFERVYEVKVLGKVKYLTKEMARKAHDELYKTKKVGRPAGRPAKKKA